MSRILIDGRFVGVGDSQTRLVLELVRNILKIDQENQYTLLIRPQGIESAKQFLGKDIVISTEAEKSSNKRSLDYARDDKAKKFKNLQVDILDIPHYSIAEQTKLLKYLNREKFDLVHFTQFNHPVLYRGNYVITIQDLTLVGHLHYFNFIRQIAFNSVMKSAVKNSKKIITISKTTEHDVIDFFGTDRNKFTVTYLGINHERFNTRIQDADNRIQQFKNKYKIENDYILYTGMWKKHKNLKRMLLAFEKFRINNPENKTQLVLVGKIDTNEPEVINEIERINNPSSINHQPLTIVATGFIDEEELPIANAGALAYCIPSLSEGFGWPPLEAMACGTPVISSNLSCMPEILGDAPIYFNPYDIEDIARAMNKVTKDKKLRADSSRKGLEQVKKYNWQECAQETLKVYKKALL